MSDESICDAFKAATVQCVAMDMTGECQACIDIETLAVDFPSSLKSLFASTQAFAIPGTPQYCSVAQDRVCGEISTNYSCCCDEQIAEWQNCLVEQVFSKDLSLAQPCTSNCGGGGNSGGGGGSTAMYAGIGAAVGVVVVALLTWCYCRRRRNRAAAAAGDVASRGLKGNGEETIKDSKTNSDRDQGALDDMEEGRLTSDEDDSSSHDPKSSAPPAVVNTKPLKDDEISEVDHHDHEGDRVPSKASMSSARHKKKAIEEWHKQKKAGSNRSLDSFVSGEGSDDEGDAPRRTSSRNRSRDRESRSSDREPLESGVPRKKLPKKISSRDLSRILQENTDNAEKLREVENEREEVEEQLYRKDREAEKLRRSQEEVQRKLDELEAENRALKKELKGSGSSSHRRSHSRESSSERRSSRDERRSERRSRSRSSSKRSSKDRSSDKPASFKESLNKVEDLTTTWDHEHVKKYSK
ncbi:MAG: hypothetical protein SGILL_005693 [Bacillariaceae sp.]